MRKEPDMAAKARRDGVIVTENASGNGSFVLLCDHASKRIPHPYRDLGLDSGARDAHIAWDPGALGVSRCLAALLDAPLLYPDVSRLVIDCNRDVTAEDLIPVMSETTEIPGNRGLTRADRDDRIALAHAPFHQAIDTLLDRRVVAGYETVLISIHTYTPIYKGAARPWPVGILSNADRRLAKGMIADLAAQGVPNVGDNEPYRPADGVYYTLARHGEARGLACAMVEIRNDEVATAATEALWADRLARAISATGLGTSTGAKSERPARVKQLEGSRHA